MNNPPVAPARRRALIAMAGVAMALPLAALRSALAAAAPTPLGEQEDKAKAVQYVEDAHRSKAAAPGANCASCSLYGGAAGAAAGSCTLFPGRLVKAAGWCNAWSSL